MTHYLFKSRNNGVDHSSHLDETALLLFLKKTSWSCEDIESRPPPHAAAAAAAAVGNSRGLCCSSAVTALHHRDPARLHPPPPLCHSDVGSREWGNTFQGETTRALS